MECVALEKGTASEEVDERQPDATKTKHNDELLEFEAECIRDMIRQKNAELKLTTEEMFRQVNEQIQGLMLKVDTSHLKPSSLDLHLAKLERVKGTAISETPSPKTGMATDSATPRRRNLIGDVQPNTSDGGSRSRELRGIAPRGISFDRDSILFIDHESKDENILQTYTVHSIKKISVILLDLFDIMFVGCRCSSG